MFQFIYPIVNLLVGRNPSQPIKRIGRVVR